VDNQDARGCVLGLVYGDFEKTADMVLAGVGHESPGILAAIVMASFGIVVNRRFTPVSSVAEIADYVARAYGSSTNTDLPDFCRTGQGLVRYVLGEEPFEAALRSVDALRIMAALLVFGIRDLGIQGDDLDLLIGEAAARCDEAESLSHAMNLGLR
jgi:hypothetical protein